MKLLAWIALAILLAGCSASEPSWETVSDSTVTEASHWTQNALGITYGIPETLQTHSQTEDGIYYVINEGELIVSSDTMLASDLNTAVSLLTGREAEELTVVETERFGLPEYRFAWCDTSNQGELRLYTADLVMDDIYGYLLLCSTDAAAGNQYDQQIETVFSTFGLYFDETM